MADPRWEPLARYRDAIAADLALALEIWESRDWAGGAQARPMESKAFQKALQDAYSSFEQAALYVLTLADEPRPVGDAWHEHLPVMVTRPSAARPALAAELVKPLRQLRRFRHVAMHAYQDFEMALSDHTAAAARQVLGTLPAAFGSFGRDFGLLPPARP